MWCLERKGEFARFRHTPQSSLLDIKGVQGRKLFRSPGDLEQETSSFPTGSHTSKFCGLHSDSILPSFYRSRALLLAFKMVTLALRHEPLAERQVRVQRMFRYQRQRPLATLRALSSGFAKHHCSKCCQQPDASRHLGLIPLLRVQYVHWKKFERTPEGPSSCSLSAPQAMAERC